MLSSSFHNVEVSYVDAPLNRPGAKVFASVEVAGGSPDRRGSPVPSRPRGDGAWCPGHCPSEGPRGPRAFPAELSLAPAPARIAGCERRTGSQKTPATPCRRGVRGRVPWAPGYLLPRVVACLPPAETAFPGVVWPPGDRPGPLPSSRGHQSVRAGYRDLGWPSLPPFCQRVAGGLRDLGLLSPR